MTKQRTFSEENQLAATALAKTEPATNGALVVQSAAPHPLTILQQALERGTNPDDMGKLMDLAERYERNQAAAAFGNAVARFQQLCPAVHKSRQVDAGPLRYQYASFDDVMREAGPHLSECGIALSFSTEANDRGIRVTCRVRVGIHAEDYTLDVPVPDMKVNATQRYGAALSYAKRYALCAALNIVVTDEDDDAGSCGEPITEQQEIELTELIEAKGANKAKFLEWLGVKGLADIPATDFSRAVNALKAKK